MELEKYRSRQLPKHPVIYMPVKWCRVFGINIGEEVDITCDKRNIFIERANPDSIYNKRYVTEKNAINIPKEIKEELGIEPYQLYSLYIDKKNERFIISLGHLEEPVFN
ncbi:hypothetical protein SAMN05421743_105243 [Thalassobacillus cyri]|uniref:SpoVT-AbrB domain-containing protein n=1 Tax=Thalassobacillus cyri TaxID=571932 RepID=A0A1H4C2U4_9BACI|nr:hypothetical protein [Thalassobacillus cyri]SEA54706.1 hypothetical protein SAMN05421743_105243 [Thalassobacillus cyri]